MTAQGVRIRIVINSSSSKFIGYGLRMENKVLAPACATVFSEIRMPAKIETQTALLGQVCSVVYGHHFAGIE